MPRSSIRSSPGEYVFKRGNALVPTWTAFAVSQLLETHLPESGRLPVHGPDGRRAGRHQPRRARATSSTCASFTSATAAAGLKPQLENKVGEIDARSVSRISLGTPAGQEEIVVRVGRYGPFLEQGNRRAAIPDGTAPDELTIEKSSGVAWSGATSRGAGWLRSGYRQAGLPQSRPLRSVRSARQCRRRRKTTKRSLLKGMKPEEVDLATALQLLSLPRTLGTDPKADNPWWPTTAVSVPM